MTRACSPPRPTGTWGLIMLTPVTSTSANKKLVHKLITSPGTFFFFFFQLQHVGSSFFDQGLNLGPLKWKCRALTTGPPGMSLTLPLKVPPWNPLGSLGFLSTRCLGLHVRCLAINAFPSSQVGVHRLVLLCDVVDRVWYGSTRRCGEWAVLSKLKITSHKLTHCKSTIPQFSKKLFSGLELKASLPVYD